MSIYGNPVMLGGSGGGGGGRLYTNGYAPGQQITDISGFTKLYDTSLQYGNMGSKVNTNLALTDEATIESRMSGGWQSSAAAFYDAENLIGAYGGYSFNQGIDLSSAKFWIGRYSGQNTTLVVTIEYMDENGNWNEISDENVLRTLAYPVNVFSVEIPSQTIYGLRWIHKKQPYKSGGNNITFFGMTMYGVGSKRVYIPNTTGVIDPPTGYDGFGPLYIM